MKESFLRKYLVKRGALLMALAASIGAFADSPMTSVDPHASNNVNDPGPRAGSPAAGGAMKNLTAAEGFLFSAAQSTFTEVDSVLGTLPGETGSGLGPSFNLNSCAGCHAYPAIGGASPQLNPQIAMAVLHGANNSVPSFISSSGPIRVARFKTNSDGTPDGGVHDLFVITGRNDAPSGCRMPQTDFASELSQNNVIFRIPTPTLGSGLIESIPDATILANKAANASAKSNFGISGHENRSGNDGSLTRFGWKAQNKSLLVFSGEAYNVEMGVTNEAFPNPRQTDPSCDTLGHPEDHTGLTLEGPSDIVQFSMFMRLLAPPASVGSYGDVSAASIQNGHSLFAAAGCVLCHTESLGTGVSSIAALSHQSATLFSDLILHNMGAGLADGISQGNAAGNEFRTAPLWGLGKRLFLLHDGRTSDLLTAIQAHSGNGSEANTSISTFNALTDSNRQDLLNFLRSL